MKNQASPRSNTQAGSIFVWIFIMVGLFAALSWAMTQGSRTGASTLTDQQAKLVATNLIQKADQIKSAVKAMRINGCKDSEISFESAATGITYVNPTTPSDGRCKVFHPQGGGLTDSRDFPAGIAMYYMARSSFRNIGISTCGDGACSDLYMALMVDPISSPEILCEQYNKLLGNLDLIPAVQTTYMYVGAGSPFVGTYGPMHEPTHPKIDGKYAACFRYNSDPTRYLFYYILLAR